MQQQSGPMFMTRRQLLTVGALVSGAIALHAAQPEAAEAMVAAGASADANGISHTASAIHQEPEFAASAARVYAALLDPRQFDRIVELSGVREAMHLQNASSRINPHVGGAFALFGGYITGRQLELVRNQRIVQAWRAASWPAGIHSVARFELQAHEAGCRLVFDHTGIPGDEAKSLAEGWQSHYWEPIRRLLAVRQT
jgi:activator of HSP90 ATPase